MNERWEIKTIGRSVQGRSIVAFLTRRSSAPLVLVLGGMHGDEPKSVFVAEQLVAALLDSAGRTAEKVSWCIVPWVNPDGIENRTRRNARRVDLNRNFPTKNWSPGSPRSRMFGGPSPASEPETRAIVDLVERRSPDAIVTIHSIGRHRFCNNYDGPARRIAARLSKHNGYPVAASIGYPTPGSFGTWAGREKRISTITLELPSHDSPWRCWRDNREALLTALPKCIRFR